MHSPTHRPAMSATNITPPNVKQRRMSVPVPPPRPLNLPEPGSPQSPIQHNHSRSPLRNGITLDPATGTFSDDGSPDDNDDQDPWGTHEQDSLNSPSPSITKFASSLAQRVGSLVSSVSPSSHSTRLPTEEELEAEAESQRARSRQEAERILNEEATERKKVEERVMEMLDSSRTRPMRSQTVPSPGDFPSPTPSNKESGTGWWSAAKNKLSPTKELTPAQQIVMDTKAREKEKRKSKERDWTPNGKDKYSDSTSFSLSLPPGARPPGGMVGGGANVVPSPPISPSPNFNRLPSQSPSRSPAHTPINPRPIVLPRPSSAPSALLADDEPPLYAKYSSQGALDVPGTLLLIARRFEKLERWSVSHVRALEERMSDVEKWLVDKERERTREAGTSKVSHGIQPDVPSKDDEKGARQVQQVVREITIERKTVEVDQGVKREVGEIKEELGELRDRVSELGREMARLGGVPHSASPSEASGFGIGRIVSPGSTGPNTPVTPSPRTLPAVRTNEENKHRQSPSTHSIAQSETASIISTSTATRTKFPYPTGDYTSPSPPGSPRSSVAQNIGNYTDNNASSQISRTRPISYSGLPIPESHLTSMGLSPSSGSGNATSSSPSHPLPSTSQLVSASPIPRKRYTVALGQPLSSSPSTSSAAAPTVASDPPSLALDEKKTVFGEGLFSDPPKVELQTAFFSHLDKENEMEDLDRQVEQKEDANADVVGLRRQETIGSTPITLSRLSLSPPPSQNASPNGGARNPGGGLKRSSPRPSPSNPRSRAQSTYGVPGSLASSGRTSSRHERSPGNGSPSTTFDGKEDAMASWRRSRSIDRIGLGVDSGPGNPNFVDPLVIRKKAREKEAAALRSPALASPGGARGKVAFGDLLAFFDSEKQ